MSSEVQLHTLLLQGLLQGQDLKEAYASADIFMMPSESETLGFVVLEVLHTCCSCCLCLSGYML